MCRHAKTKNGSFIAEAAVEIQCFTWLLANGAVQLLNA